MLSPKHRPSPRTGARNRARETFTPNRGGNARSSSKPHRLFLIRSIVNKIANSMNKTLNPLILFVLSLAGFAPGVSAQLNIPSDGSDGALIVTNDTVIDLSLAVTGVWNSNNAANAGKGIYDSNKWAVVFKYSSVVISNGATVTFANHPSRAPVVWLVSGNVTLDGVLSLDGQGVGYNAPQLAEPGPGGFRGGEGNYAYGVGVGSGFGPGGGYGGYYGVGGSYGSVGVYGPATYGNPSLIPLIGGSGGGGYNQDGRGGGGGAGAILIATPATFSISGGIHANGGSNAGGGGGGSGGAIRLVAGVLVGNGYVQCLGGSGSYIGGLGRIRIERVSNSNTIQVIPDPSVLPLQAGATPLMWLPSDGPTARIISIGTTNAPADPRASFGTFGPDITLPQASTTPVVIETVNAEDASIVVVRVTPRANGNYTETTATLTQTNSTNPLVLRWVADVPVNNGYSAVQVKVVRP